MFKFGYNCFNIKFVLNIYIDRVNDLVIIKIDSYERCKFDYFLYKG